MQAYLCVGCEYSWFFGWCCPVGWQEFDEDCWSLPWLLLIDELYVFVPEADVEDFWYLSECAGDGVVDFCSVHVVWGLRFNVCYDVVGEVLL